MVFFDTESIGFYGPTVLIQWAVDDRPVQLHNIWNTPVYKTLNLIELMMKGDLCGFNLSHDSYHLHRTYNILKHLPPKSAPRVSEYNMVEQSDYVLPASSCLKPGRALDLLLVGRKGELQSTLKQKDIVLKKFPLIIASKLVEILKEKVDIPDIYFSKNKEIRGANWRIINLHEETDKEVTPEEHKAQRTAKENGTALPYSISTDFVNIRLSFNPSAALKNIVEHVTGEKQVVIDDMRPLPKVNEYGYCPLYDGWLDAATDHIWAWTHDKERIEYAKKDVIALRTVKDYFTERGHDCTPGDDDSELAWAVGSVFWRGFDIDIGKAKKKLEEAKSEIAASTMVASGINFNAPKQVLHYLHSACADELERLVVPDTKGDTLKAITKDPTWEEEAPVLFNRVKDVLRMRRLDRVRDLMEKLIFAKRFHVMLKVVGTKSNRMSGGSESFISSRGSINPQGIKKDTAIRSIFNLAPPGYVYCAGDYDGFEISIAEAEYADPALRKDLLAGKKMHALYAAAMYDLDYDYIMQYSELGEDEELGYYARGKRAFFGSLYGAQLEKIKTVLWLEEEQVLQGQEKFFAKYKRVKEVQDQTILDHAALRQPNGIGTRVEWVDPKREVESFLGFKRDFSLEYSVQEALFNMAQNMPEDIKNVGNSIRVVRRDRTQTASGAASSAIYAAAFNIGAQVTRSAINHKIQSPGGQVTKALQRKIWDCQRSGVHPYSIMFLNVHDEINATVLPSLVDKVKTVVNTFNEGMKEKIPLISMKWKTHLNNWGEK